MRSIIKHKIWLNICIFNILGMYKGKRILAIIPARGGSKGLPRKNIKELCGKPLIAWSIEHAQKSKL